MEGDERCEDLKEREITFLHTQVYLLVTVFHLSHLLYIHRISSHFRLFLRVTDLASVDVLPL
jgi:hypothetical protein